MQNTAVLSDEELNAWLRLTLEPGVGSVTAKNLLLRFGLPQAIFEAKYMALITVVGEQLARQLSAPCSSEILAKIEQTKEWLQKKDHYLLTLADKHYPQSLLDTHDPPVVLYVDGQLAAFQKPALAIVGSRNATLGGVQNAHAFAKYLAQQGWSIISGLALGIDAAAHEGALASGQEGATIAIMGTGINRLYPAEHKNLALRIREQGTLVTEFPLDTRSQAFHFPMRNRIVAGLSKGVVVVEAAQKSGSLITAQLASEMGKDVFAIPGSIHSPLSRGCHRLIRQGAKLVETGQDILEELGYPIHHKAPEPDAKQSNKEIDPINQQLLDLMGFDPTELMALQQASSLALDEIAARLLQMELDGWIIRLRDGRYQQVHLANHLLD
ncbi:DNA-processing protein DprA [Pelistega ratti]|uniref:DNA-processing protein DprA n=1 Tax=Pelistega ratti TaxID=2652177 RepID=UPI00135C2C79|nr:DNA-processing protein DprA [Pelistega ratti]